MLTTYHPFFSSQYGKNDLFPIILVAFLNKEIELLTCTYFFTTNHSLYSSNHPDPQTM